METTITLGKSGRLVVPKAIREELGLTEGSRLKLEVQGGRLEAVPEADELEIDRTGGFSVIKNSPPLEEGGIVSAIKRDREARDSRALRQSDRK